MSKQYDNKPIHPPPFSGSKFIFRVKFKKHYMLSEKYVRCISELLAFTVEKFQLSIILDKQRLKNNF